MNCENCGYPNRAPRWPFFLLAALLAVAGAFVGGRFSAPEDVQTVEVDRWRTLDLKTEDITRGMTFAKQVEVTRWRNVKTTITTTPDAGTVTTITDNTIEREGSSEQAALTEQIKRVEFVEVEREKIVEKTVTLRPRFRVSLLAGASIVPPWISISGPLVLGVGFDVRIIGGFSVGAWLMTFGAAGGALHLEF